VIVILSLGPLRIVERRLFGSTGNRHYVQIAAANTAAFGRLLEAIDERAGKVREVGSTRSEQGGLEVNLEIRGRSGQEVAALLAELDALDGIDIASTGPDED
jgi:hypothetical protein